MSNNKQSSVEWFAEKTFNLIELLKRSYVSQEEFLGGMFKFRDEAKAKQREDMIGLLEWMNEIAKTDPMRLETDKDDIVDMYYKERFDPNTPD
jgi:hypothetical protein